MNQQNPQFVLEKYLHQSLAGTKKIERNPCRRTKAGQSDAELTQNPSRIEWWMIGLLMTLSTVVGCTIFSCFSVGIGSWVEEQNVWGPFLLIWGFQNKTPKLGETYHFR